MVINWTKVEEKPEKKHAVEGRLLLDLRDKIDSLKEKLTAKTDNLYQTEKIVDKKNDIIRALNLEIENLQNDLGESDSKVSELENLLEEKELKLLEVSRASEQEISSINSELKSAHDKISELQDNLDHSTSQIESKDKEISKLTAVFEELDMERSALNSKLSEVKELLLQKESRFKALTNALDEKDHKLEAQSIRLEELEKDLEDLKPPEIGELAFSYETRITCPKCDAVGKDIRTVEDKDTVLSYIGNIPMYAKKYVCKSCGYDWK